MAALWETAHVLILEYALLPDHMRQIFAEWPGFGNNRILEYGSADFKPEDGDTWQDMLESDAVKACLDRARSNGFEGDILDFISCEEPFIGWLAKSGISLDVTRILIKISW